MLLTQTIYYILFIYAIQLTHAVIDVFNKLINLNYTFNTIDEMIDFITIHCSYVNNDKHNILQYCLYNSILPVNINAQLYDNIYDNIYDNSIDILL